MCSKAIIPTLTVVKSRNPDVHLLLSCGATPPLCAEIPPSLPWTSHLSLPQGAVRISEMWMPRTGPSEGLPPAVIRQLGPM